MANDGSLATLIEDWIVTQIRAITIGEAAVFEASDVTPWGGTQQNAASQVADEIVGTTRDRIARVFFASDSIRDLEAGEIEVVPVFAILVAIKANRPGDSRRGGDAAMLSVGTNLMRDLLRYALHDKRPGLDDGTTYADRTRWLGSTVILARKNAYILQTQLAVHEVPKA